MLTLESALPNDFIAEHTTNFLITFVLQFEICTKKFDNLNILGIDSDHLWNELNEFLQFLLGDDSFLIKIVAVDLNNLRK